MIDYINNHYDWFEYMQMGLGHSSWWYTNRKPDDCINVKLHSWVDIDKIMAKLTDQEKQIIEVLGINLNEYLNDLVWSDFGLVEMERQSLLDELKADYNVKDIEYGGKSGGWMAIVYNWSDVYDDYDSPEYSYKEVLAFYRIIKNAVKENEKVTTLVLERKAQLEKSIADAENYIEQVKEMLADRLESEQQQASRVLAITV